MSYRIIFPKNGTEKLPENTSSLCSATSTKNASTSMFECPTCNSKFYKSRLLREHERRVHKRYILKVRDVKEKNFKCDLCDKRFSSLQTRSKHRIAKHDIKRKYKRNADSGIHLKFNTEQDFKEWLTSEEQQTKSHFIKARGIKQAKEHRLINYMCNRSGKFVSKNTGKRKLKAQGSKKIGKNCDARLRVKIYENEDAVEVTYFNEHNHELSLRHLPLPAAVKEDIAEKILNGECYSQILNDVRGDVEVPENRCHLVTRKDLNNIKSKLAMDLESSPSQFNSDDLQVSCGPQSNVIEQNVNTDEDVDNRTQILSKLVTIRNKVTLMSEISKSTTTKVMNVLESIEVLLNSNDNSITNLCPNKGVIPQNKCSSIKKQRIEKGKSNKSVTTQHPTIQHIVLEELFVTQNPMPGQNYFIVQNQN